jgi:hypothetical protein
MYFCHIEESRNARILLKNGFFVSEGFDYAQPDMIKGIKYKF